MNVEFWNERFNQEQYVYGEQPNAFIEHRHTLILPGSRVLVLGDGEGRNGVFLARRRNHVTSVDASPVAIEKAQKLAKKYRADITTIEGVLPDVDIEENAWDAVVLVYLHLPESARKKVHALAAKVLKSNGILLLEAFTPEQLKYDSGGPKDEALLYTKDMLKKDFEGIEFEGAEELETVLDEGPGHQGKAHVVRLIGVKP